MHRDSKVAKRYAKSLMDFAQEQNSLEAVAADMELIAATIDGSRELELLLKSPIIKLDKKVAIMNQIFGGKIGSISQSFLGIIARKGRESLIEEMAVAFVNLYKASQGIVTAEITTAIPLDDKGREKAKALIAQISDKVELIEKINEDIIGGFIIRVGDKQYDESVSSRLSAMKREFSKNPHIAEL